MGWLLRDNIGKRVMVLFFGDSLISFFAFIFAFNNVSGDKFANVRENSLNVTILIFIVTSLFFSIFIEIYTCYKKFNRKSLLLRSFFASVLSFVLFTAISFLVPIIKVDNSVLITALSTFAAGQYLWHLLCHLILNHPAFARNVLIIGTGVKAETIGNLLENAECNFRLKGFLGTPFDPVTVLRSKIIGDVNSLNSIVKESRIHTIVIALTERRGNLIMDELVKCKLSGIKILDYPYFFELLTGKLMVEDINPSWFLQADGFRITQYIRFYKRLTDFILAFIGLMLAIPISPFVAFAVKLSSKGPVIYRQVRTGVMGKDFYIFKFRTMKQDAETGTGAVWAGKNDPRITSVGSFLRKTRIDELPQLFNVLKGDMSFIGPRPERPEFVQQIKELTAFYSERHFVKPGLTGWAQIKYPYGDSFGDSIEKLRYDLFYIKNISLPLDLMIVFETIKVILLRRGGR